MDLGVTFGTIIGAMAGLGSSVVVERTRWTLGSSGRRHEELKASYARYLAALSTAVEQIWAAARQQTSDWRERVLTSMGDSGIHEARLELSLIAADDVVKQAEDVSEMLMAWRDVIADGAAPNGPEDKEAWLSYFESRSKLLGLMRKDLRTKA